MRFLFDFDNYFKMVGLAWREPAAKPRHYSLTILLFVIPLVSSFHALCFLLDGIFFPGIRKVKMQAPIFMVGHARSGTTLTHRLLSSDDGRFSSFLLWESYLPSLLQKKFVRAVAALDARLLNGVIEKLVQRWEKRRYGPMRHMHNMGLTQPEEDDIALYYSMASGFWITKIPMDELDFYRMNDWSQKKRRRYNDFYRNCVRRQLYLNGPEKIHLSKNPMYSGRVASLIEAFPDARFIINVRNPNETIPSLLKLVRTGWKHLGWDAARQQRCLDMLAGQASNTYLHPFQALNDHPEIRHTVVDYRRLISDPAATIEQIYHDLELTMSADFKEKLAGESRREKQHSTRHRYTLEEFSLDTDTIRAELSPLFERFEWDKSQGDS